MTRLSESPKKKSFARKFSQARRNNVFE